MPTLIPFDPSSLFPSLLFWTLKAGLILSAAGVVTYFARRLSASFRHHVWLLALVAVLLLPVATLLAPSWEYEPVNRILPSALAQSENSAIDTGTTADLSISLNTVEPHNQPFDWAGFAVLVWLVGIGAMAIRLVVALAHTRWVLAAGTTPPSHSCRLLNEARARLGIKGPVRLIVSKRAGVPFTAGMTRNTIVLPISILGWPEDQVRSTLLHELAHIRRHDMLAMALTSLVTAVQWFNPIVWYARRRLQAERECATDDFVLNHGVRSSDYAAHLLNIAKGLRTAQWGAPLTAAMARPRELEGRLMAILDSNRSRRGLTGGQLAVVLCLFAAILAGTASYTATAQTAILPPVEIAAAPGGDSDSDDIRKTLTLLCHSLQEKDWDRARTCLESPENLRVNGLDQDWQFRIAGHPDFKIAIPDDMAVLNWDIKTELGKIDVQGNRATVEQAMTIDIMTEKDEYRFQMQVDSFTVNMVRKNGKWLVSDVTGLTVVQFRTANDTLNAHWNVYDGDDN